MLTVVRQPSWRAGGMLDSNYKLLQSIRDNLVRIEQNVIVNPVLCARTHTQLLVGKCPWCGLQIERGMKPSEVLERST